MFENIDLISYSENKELHNKQTDLIKKFENDKSGDILIRIALLQTLSPICDRFSAVRIMESYMMDSFEFLIIGAYLSAECLDITENKFLSKLLNEDKFDKNNQKSIVKYLQALHEYNRECCASKNVIQNVLESIELCDKFSSNFYFRYLISHNNQDKMRAKNNVVNILTEKDIANLSIDCMINPHRYIEEHITMVSLNEKVYNALFSDI